MSPYRRRISVRRYRRGSTHTREIQWTRMLHEWTIADGQTPQVNLVGALQSDPAVFAQIQAGTPEILAYAAGAYPVEGTTLERVHLTLNVDMTETQSLYLGLIVYTIGTATVYPVPDPHDQCNSADWIMWRVIKPWAAGQSVIAPSGLYHQQIEIDVKSRRRIKEQGQTFYLVGHWSNTVTAAEKVGINSSLLYKMV